MQWLNITKSKFYDWKYRYGKKNKHYGRIPRDSWLRDCDKKAIIDFFIKHPNVSYRKLTCMLVKANIVAVSPTCVYRVLRKAGLIGIASQK